MGKLKIYGASDDLIEIKGDFSEEINVLSGIDDGGYLAFSNGNVIRVEYNGTWRFHPVSIMWDSYSNKQCTEASDDNYSDIVTIEQEGHFFSWVAFIQHDQFASSF